MATIMAKRPDKEKEEAPKHCTYASVKIDDQLTRLIRIAAANKDVSIQELMSDILNEGVAEILGTDPIERRKPPERKPKP